MGEGLKRAAAAARATRTQSRLIQADIAELRMSNKADPPKAARQGKEIKIRPRVCSRCGAGDKGKPPMLDWGYRGDAIICSGCLYREMEQKAAEPRTETIHTRGQDALTSCQDAPNKT